MNKNVVEGTSKVAGVLLFPISQILWKMLISIIELNLNNLLLNYHYVRPNLNNGKCLINMPIDGNSSAVLIVGPAILTNAA